MNEKAVSDYLVTNFLVKLMQMVFQFIGFDLPSFPILLVLYCDPVGQCVAKVGF